LIPQNPVLTIAGRTANFFPHWARKWVQSTKFALTTLGGRLGLPRLEPDGKAEGIMSKPWTDKRPMSPHLSAWKWHPTMLSSILNRATGIVLYFGILKLCVGLLFLAAGPAYFAKVSGLLYSPLGAFVFFVVMGILLYHLINGLRHLAWDAGKGFDPKFANVLSILIIAAAAIAAAGLTYVLVGSLT
jgi:succinate dehydrogenase / fumarate reductase cytochrome b subunit